MFTAAGHAQGVAQATGLSLSSWTTPKACTRSASGGCTESADLAGRGGLFLVASRDAREARRLPARAGPARGVRDVAGAARPAPFRRSAGAELRESLALCQLELTRLAADLVGLAAVEIERSSAAEPRTCWERRRGARRRDAVARSGRGSELRKRRSSDAQARLPASFERRLGGRRRRYRPRSRRPCPPPHRLTRAWRRPRDLRDWIALLEREGELVRVSAEVDPDLEITEIVDRTVKAGGPALLFENPKGSEHPLLINQFGTERRMCLAFGAQSLDEVATRLQSVIEMQPPQGLAEKVRGLAKLKSIADSMPKSVRSGPSQEIVLQGDDVNLDLLPIQRCWPGDPAPFITLPAVITKDPRNGHAQRRHVPDAEDRQAVDVHALAGAQGRAHGLPGHRRAARRRRRARARPGHGVLGERAAPEAHRRAHARRLPARRAGRARAREDRRPRRAGERRDRARGLRRGGRRGRSRARSATTPATTRPPSRSRSSTSRR